MTGWADFSPWRAHQLIHMFALGLPLALIIQRGWSPLARANCSPVKLSICCRYSTNTELSEIIFRKFQFQSEAQWALAPSASFYHRNLIQLPIR
jgi:hypothetical protein